MTDFTTARQHALTLMAELSPFCESLEIAGSVRRGKHEVKDVEFVAQPIDSKALLARLDHWVMMGFVRKAIYPDGSMRWGEKYRGFVYEGIRFELFSADADNWGYQFWLRTGPGDANQYVMRQCISFEAPYRAREGYWWVGEDKLTVPDEDEMFRLLGMPLIEPQNRTLERYQRLMASPWWAQTWTLAAKTDDAQQMCLL